MPDHRRSEAVEEREDAKTPWRLVYFRVIILVASTLASTMAVANTMVLNFTIVDMIERNNTNMTTATEVPKVRWTATQEGAALASFSWGALLGIVPLSFILQKYGSHSVFTITALIGAFMTLITPVTVVYNYHLFLITRAFQGNAFDHFSFPLTFPYPCLRYRVFGRIANAGFNDFSLGWRIGKWEIYGRRFLSIQCRSSDIYADLRSGLSLNYRLAIGLLSSWRYICGDNSSLGSFVPAETPRAPVAA